MCRVKGVGLAGVLCLATSYADAQSPIRLNDVSGLPDGLSVSGAYRVRLEGVDGRFRSGFDGTDQILVQRLTLAAEYDFGGLYIGGEFIDSRQQLADDGTPIGTDDVNPAELLQGYIGYRTDNAFLQGDSFDIKAGRMTLNIAPRRLSARNGFRNTINSFNGIRADWTAPNSDELIAFYTLPVRRQPSDRDSLLNNQVVFDRESFNQRFWAINYTRPDLFLGTSGTLYVYGLQEEDNPDFQTRDRNLFTPGFRLNRPPDVGQLDFEIDAALQFGESNLSSNPTAPELDHFAQFFHAQLGYTFDGPFEVRLLAQYDFASGDNDPFDGDNGRFDSFFGARGFELGQTGIFGPFARSNFHSVGGRVIADPTPWLNGLFSYRAAYLASARDVFTTAGVQDQTGAAGNFIGHLVETRWKFDILPGNAQLEIGASYLVNGRFLIEAPNASPSGDTLYGYTQITFTF